MPKENALQRGLLFAILALALAPLSTQATDQQLAAALPDRTLECWYWGKAYDPESGRHAHGLQRSNMESLTLRPDGIYETGIEVRNRYDFDTRTRQVRLHGRLYGGIVGYLASDSRGFPMIAFSHMENAAAPEAQDRDVPAIDPADTICAAEQP